MDWAKDLALLLTAVGAATLIPKFINRAWQLATGRSVRKRNEIDRLRWLLDDESDWRRALQESLSETRRAALDQGIHEDELPDIPKRRERRRIETKPNP